MQNIISRRVPRAAALVVAVMTTASTTFAVQQPPIAVATLTAEVRIDGKREDFAVLNGGNVGPIGLLALTFRQDAQIRLYDMKGKRVAVVGKRGSGQVNSVVHRHKDGWPTRCGFMTPHSLEVPSCRPLAPCYVRPQWQASRRSS